MAGKMSNLSNAFKDAKSRTILLVVLVIVILAVIVGYIGLSRGGKLGVSSSAAVQSAPRVSGGVGETPPSRAYVQKVQEENLLKSQEAARTGQSHVDVITRASYQSPGEFLNNVTGECSIEALSRARQAGVKAEELRCKGCDAESLRAAGYSAGELLDAGFTPAQLKAAGYSAAELRMAGLSAANLRDAGFSTNELLQAGFAPAELNQAGVSQQALQAAGANLAALAERANPNMPKTCDVEVLRLAKQNGISASQIRKTLGCDAKAMRAAGFTASDLKSAGYSAGELRQAGFSATELKAAGFSAHDLRDAGFSAAELANAGFTASELAAAGFSDGDLVRAGFSPQQAQVAMPTVAVPSLATNPPALTTTIPSVAQATATETGNNARSERQEVLDFEKLRKIREQQLSADERAERLTQLQQAMTSQASDLIASWTPPPTQQMVIASNEQNNADGNSPAPGQGGQPTQAVKQVIKAGTIEYAVLDTAVDSDEPSPVLATIVEGPLKGAKLVGNFNRVDEKVVLQFNLINIPHEAQSLNVQAVAIDPNTSRTAIATAVNNHYLLRYGSLAAASFISGLADAVSQSGSTTTTTVTGTTQTMPELNSGQEAIVALGEVGKQYSTKLGANFTLPPTVRVAAGAGIGILLMADLAIPETANQGLIIKSTNPEASSQMTQQNGK